MNNIVILGCGNQAAKHLACYGKLKGNYPINIAALVDPSPERREACKTLLLKAGFSTNTAFCASELDQLKSEIDLSKVIIDVVTPNRLHFSTAHTAALLGAKHLIIEKPLAHNLVEAKKFLDLPCTIHVLENYLFSSVTRSVVDYMRRFQCKPLFIKTEFSKDRRADSASGRGMVADYVPHVFTVEIPHQIAIANYVAASTGRVADAWEHDMILPDGRIAGHGEGAITLLHADGVASYNFSCLQGFRHMSMSYRSVKVYCSNDVRIFGYFSTAIDLKAAVLVYRKNRLVETQSLTDDSLTTTLGESISGFRKHRKHLNNVKFGVDVLRTIQAAQRIAANSH